MILRFGDVGDRVAALQKKLVRAGHDIAIDGWFGAATEAAVCAYQHAEGLVVDGIAGPKTLAALRGRPLPKSLRQADIARAADRLGVSVAVVQAVNEVESRGRGFFDNGDPVILYERHIMYRRLAAHDIDRTRWVEESPGIVNPTPGGYVGGPREHQRVAQAAEISEPCALESASWGLFQIMGFHWQGLGYDSAQAFVERMHESEAAQLEAFIRFIERDPALLRALRLRRWGAFAARYNGPAYRRNAYDIKLARAFERYHEQEAA
jgi:hypothetical protein